MLQKGERYGQQSDTPFCFVVQNRFISHCRSIRIYCAWLRLSPFANFSVLHHLTSTSVVPLPYSFILSLLISPFFELNFSSCFAHTFIRRLQDSFCNPNPFFKTSFNFLSHLNFPFPLFHSHFSFSPFLNISKSLKIQSWGSKVSRLHYVNYNSNLISVAYFSWLALCIKLKKLSALTKAKFYLFCIFCY